MPIWMPKDTRDALGANAEKCESRSLLFDRFATPDSKDDGETTPRKDWFRRVMALTPSKAGCAAWHAIASAASSDSHLLYAQLQGRLMVNMAGGVMENAGLCLDRFGLPYIPGSAVKGCTRRMAIQELLEAREAVASANELAKLLTDIARVFGWGEEDWDISKRTKEGRIKSDLAWAVGVELWPDVIIECGRTLLHKALKSPKDFGHFAGSVSFLPAHLVDIGRTGKVDGLSTEVPLLGKLELDVVTCHHGEYYASDNPNAIATDTEDPLPVFFPAVASGHIFAFAQRPLRGADAALVARARTWLATGLATLGLGAKTAAGYGWFETEQTPVAVTELLAAQQQAMAEQKRRAEEAAARKNEEEEARRQRELHHAAMSAMTPEQQDDFKLAQLTNDQFRSAVDNFANRAPEEQKAIVRAMRLDPTEPNSRRHSWDDLKAKAQKKGGKSATTEQAIRALSKQLFPGKEGKMP